ncbi:hypothetical protein PHMEG_00025703 [Phytophthora megakarya]|uniref:Uncharacterized protein n=1 Tax=Phytophthora megakarya TaxID=4795 RepID=A0A225VBE8_9STRA|nr:hypothetical protein PHMEG_00025703 [Phytophthora megakarya]
MDVLEYWQKDTDRCTLMDAEDAIQGRAAEDIVVHVSLRKNILVEFLRRPLILSFLDEVPWFQHVPEEFFDRALAEAEDDDWALGLAEGVNPWPPVPLQPRDSPSPSEHEEDASGLYWGSSCPEERIAESVSPTVWGTRVTVHANRLPVPEPEEYVMPRGRR